MDKSRKEESTDKGSKDQQSGSTLEELFKGFSSSQGKDSDGKTIDLEGVKKWFKQANVSQISSDDIGDAFSKKAGSKKQLSIDEFNDMIKELAKEKKLQLNDLMDQMKSVKLEEKGKGIMDSIKGFFSGSDDDNSNAKEQDENAAIQKGTLNDQTKSPQDPSKN